MLHQCKLFPTDHAPGLSIERAMNRYKIRFGEQLFELDPFATYRSHMRLRNVGIRDLHVHLESARTEPNAHADVSHADDTQPFAGELRADEFEVVAPAIILHRSIRL